MHGKQAQPHEDNQQNVFLQSQPLTPKNCLSCKQKPHTSGKQSNSSTLKPLKIVTNDECSQVKSRLSFQKKDKDSSESCFHQRESRTMQYGISGLDLTGVADKSRLTANGELPDVGEILRMTERFAERVGTSQEDENSLFRVRAMYRLVELLTRIMEAPANSEELIAIGGIEHQDSLNLLIDRYEFALEQQERELDHLKHRLRSKEEELLDCQKRMMNIMEHNNQIGFIPQNRLPLEMSDLSSLASPFPSRKCMSIDGVSEVRSRNRSEINLLQGYGSPNGRCTEPFIKVCDGYPCQSITETKLKHENLQFVVGLTGQNSCLFSLDDASSSEDTIIENTTEEHDTAQFGKAVDLISSEELLQIESRIQPTPLESFAKISMLTAIEGEDAVMEQQVNSSMELCKSAKVQCVIIPIISMVETGCQTQEKIPATPNYQIYTQSDELIPLLLQTDPSPQIFEEIQYIASATVTVQNSRNIANSLQPAQLSERDWVEQEKNCQTQRINSQVAMLKKSVENVLSISISHTTVERDPHKKLKLLKGLVKCLSSAVNSNWRLLLHTRQRNKTTFLSRSTMKLTKDKIELFERWFNDKYDILASRSVKQAPEIFYADTLQKIQEFTSQIAQMVHGVCEGAS